MGNPKLFIGTFDSEKFWKPEDFSSLPLYDDIESERIISVMDEMQFAFCSTSHDILITRHPIDICFSEYLDHCGFRFKTNIKPVKDNYESDSKNENIFELMKMSRNLDYFRRLIPDNSVLSVYSVIPGIRSFCELYNVGYHLPEPEIVSRVNSKKYSSEVSKEIFGYSISKVVESAAELYSNGVELIKKSGNFLIKDPFGVSGKGILFIGTIFSLKRICFYLETQEKKGKKTFFIIEPMLDKEMDFSCQTTIDNNGNVEIESVHINDVIGFKHSRCRYADTSFLNYLENNHYLEQVELVCKQLYKEKYTGPVCIDSMKLKDGSIMALVEINARKSMTLFHHSLRKKFSDAVESVMIQMSLLVKKCITVEDFLDVMKKSDLLFNPGKMEGIFPLSCNAVVINGHKGECSYKAALFAVILTSGMNSIEFYYNKLKTTLYQNHILTTS